MISKGSKIGYFFHCFLMLICLTFCLSACIKISGEVTCDKCESGQITIEILDCTTKPIVEKRLDGCGTYSFSISPFYIGEKLAVVAHCDEDNDGEYSIGDGFGGGEWFELQQSNGVNIDINRELTATIEGDVSCDTYTSGLVNVAAFDEVTPVTPLSSIVNYFPLNEEKKGSYKIFVYDIPLGSEVWLLGYWDKDGSGVCYDKVINECDYRGRRFSIILDNKEMTGIDFDTCQYQIKPCQTPQDEYAIDNLPGCDDCPNVLDEAILAELVNKIEDGDYGNIHSLIIIHNDGLALEKYFMEWNRHMLHDCFSVTKSFTSALVGIAIDQGKIDGVAESLLNYFPEYNDIENLDERKESITLENILTMTAGFTWNERDIPLFDNEGNPNLENDAMKLYYSSDWVKYMLDLPMSDDPGTKWYYSTGCSMLLSGVIANEIGQSAEEFAKENLFSKIGITNWEWETGPDGITNTGSGLALHPVNMAMFGYLFLKNGLLNGNQIVPESWVEESTSRYMPLYGYQWWVMPDVTNEYPETEGIFYAMGHGGQSIMIIPNINMVVVTTAENPADPTRPMYDMLFDYILPAVKEK